MNQNNLKRNILLQHLCSEHKLSMLPLLHKTYHHFTGGGQSDSNLDKIMFSSPKNPESLTEVICKLTNPLINSHHDLISSSFKLNPMPPKSSTEGNVKAPRVQNCRTKVIWSESGINDYQNLVFPQLSRLQNLWLTSPTRTCLSLFMKSTNAILNSAVSLTNKTIQLNSTHSPRSKPIPKVVRKSQQQLLKLSRKLKLANDNGASKDVLDNLKKKLKLSKSEHQRLVRQTNAQVSIDRDKELHTVLSKDPSSFYKSVRRSKSLSASQIQSLNVGERLYLGSEVVDYFFDSLSTLKSLESS